MNIVLEPLFFLKAISAVEETVGEILVARSLWQYLKGYAILHQDSTNVCIIRDYFIEN